MADRVYSDRKVSYFERFSKLLDQYSEVLVVGADNVRSTQMHQIRRSLRGKGLLLMGKNTVMRKVLRLKMKTNPKLESLLYCVKENVGFVFVEEGSSLSEVRNICVAHKLAAPAKAGAISPCQVIVPKGPTGMEPTQTAFLQALNIATKINKGQIEIINDVTLLEEGDKVGSSEAALLQKLNMMPFSYGLTVRNCWEDGFSYDPKILDVTPEMVVEAFQTGIANIACVSLEVGIPTLPAVPHVLLNSYKNLLAVVLETDIVFKQAQAIKDRFENPDAFAAAAPAAAAESSDAAAPAAPAEEEEEESDEGLGGGLFGDDDDW
eukprot:TRINITY_DN213_c0_g1_i1.p1 TRINITY_DN213_c0_g1~~TRINITY_DN213_c0_g1_i1.p1  ORF type:complete len:321 (-),score=135.05 TRINITY_DN213_c0_g1_i1:201-1163(-)